MSGPSAINRVRWVLVAALALGASACGPVQSTSYLIDTETMLEAARTAQADKLAPYVADYDVKYGRFSVGSSRTTLARDGDGWVLESATNASGLYRMIAGSKSSLGRDAMGRLSRLDGGRTLGEALAIEPKLDRQGRVWLVVGNRASQPVGSVSLLVGVVNRSGRTVAGPARVGTGAGVIPPGHAVEVRTPLGPYDSTDALRYVRWKIERVELAR